MWKTFGNSVSRLTGKVANCPIPKPLRSVLIGGFAAAFKIDQAESDVAISDARSINEYFTRDLKTGVRPIVSESLELVSPADSRIDQMGPISDSALIQAKGLNYSVQDLLQTDTTEFNSGSFATLYLSPQDCHRVYSPANGTILSTTHIPGHLYPVRPPYTTQKERLFAHNERLVIEMDSPIGKIAVVMVGAFNVGCIRTPFDPEIRTNIGVKESVYRDYTPAISVRKGEWIGTFELGSTVILLVATPNFRFADTLHIDQHVQIGNTLGVLR